MYIYNCNSLYILFVLFVFILNINAQSLNSNELKCLTDLSYKLGIPEITSCNDINYQCTQMSDGYHVNQILVEQKNTNTITASDFACFPNITYLELRSCSLVPNLLAGPFSDSLKFIRIKQGNNLDQQFQVPIYNKLESIDITFGSNINLVINLSYVQTIKNSFNLYFSDNAVQKNSKLVLNNDLVSPWSFAIMYLYTNTIPNLTNVYISSECTIQLVSPATEGYGNIKTFGGIRTLYFYHISEAPLDFPLEFTEIDITLFSTLFMVFKHNLNKPSNYIDFSKTKILQFNIYYPGPNFNIDGNVPIIFPKTLLSIGISDGNFSNIPNFNGSDIVAIDFRYCNLKFNLSNYNINSFPSTLRSLSLGNNQIVGSIDSSFCSITLNVFNNSLTGSLPTCISCYYSLLGTVVGGGNNKYEPITPCSTIIPSISNSEGLIEVTGQDIGYGSGILYASIVLLESNTLLTTYYSGNKYQFYGSSFKNSKLFNITFPTSPPQILTLSSDITIAPIVNLVKPDPTNKNTFIFEGQNFNTYNISNIQVTIDSTQCQVKSVGFYSFKCSVSSDFDLSPRRVAAYIKVNQVAQTQITISDFTQENIIKSCANECGSEYCLSDTGKCGCLFKCYNGGTCDSSFSKCHCPSNWFGDSCLLPVHYVSAITPSSIEGGEVKIYGFFGDVHNDLSVFIGDKECSPIISNSSDTIVCISQKGSGIKDLNVTQNGLSFFGKSMYSYINPILICPKNCTSKDNGICDTSTGNCKCNGNYFGYDCSSFKSIEQNNNTNSGENNNNQIIIPISTTTIDNESAITKISNQETFYEISITELHEVSISGESINVFNLVKKWDITNEPDSQSYIFTQQLGSPTSTITYIIQEISETTNITFADTSITLEPNSVKISVIIENYPFISSLSTLSLYFNTIATEDNHNNNQNNYQCNKKETEIDASDVNNDQMINSYISISKNSKTLAGRILNKAVSDNKTTFISSKIVSKDLDQLVLSINLPHCNVKCELDPDFSVLVSPEFKECNISNDNKSWVIPVAVVLPCVVVVVSIIIVSIGIGKNRATVLLIKNKFISPLKPIKKQNLYMPGDK